VKGGEKDSVLEVEVLYFLNLNHFRRKELCEKYLLCVQFLHW